MIFIYQVMETIIIYQLDSMNKKLSLLRLQKETADLQNNPIQNAIVVREGNLNFHFCLYGLDPPYSGGFYHGVLQLHEDYPFRAPKLIFFTPSGRFQVGTPICTSFTNFHQQTWTSAWNVRTLIIATISFMYSDQPSHGCRQDNQLVRKALATTSKRFNMRNPQFLKVFENKLSQMPLQLQQQEANSAQRIPAEQLIPRNEQLIPRNEIVNIQVNGGIARRKKRILICLLIILVVWVVM